MKIGIMGVGVVGDAIVYSLEQVKFAGEVVKYDPAKLGTRVTDLFDCDIVFICVPTPTMASGEQDLSMVDQCLAELVDEFSGVVAIKSTTLPTNMEVLVKRYDGLVIVSNPEFLTAGNARKDFLQARVHIIGCDLLKDADTLVAFYRTWWPHSKVIVTNLKTAMFVKYLRNSFLALKVSWANEMSRLWSGIKNKKDSPWADVVEMFRQDPRIGDTHLQVPGPDGRHGFGGACLPKDVTALMRMSVMEAEESLWTLVAAMKINRIVREGGPEERGLETTQGEARDGCEQEEGAVAGQGQATQG